MKYILFLNILFSFFSYSQSTNEEDLYKIVISDQIEFELETANYSLMNIHMMGKKNDKLKLNEIKDVKLEILNDKEIKKRSKKGIDLLT